MLRRGFAAVVLVLTGTVAATNAGGGCLFRYKDCPKPAYSPLHYWTPTLYRVAAGRTFTGDYTYAPAEGQTHIVNYRCPPVEPFYRYVGTGLPYDPAGPFAPLAPIEPPGSPNKEKTPYR